MAEVGLMHEAPADRPTGISSMLRARYAGLAVTCPAAAARGDVHTQMCCSSGAGAAVG